MFKQQIPGSKKTIRGHILPIETSTILTIRSQAIFENLHTKLPDIPVGINRCQRIISADYQINTENSQQDFFLKLFDLDSKTKIKRVRSDSQKLRIKPEIIAGHKTKAFIPEANKTIAKANQMRLIKNKLAIII